MLILTQSMKVAVVFFFSLCFLVLKGGNYAHAESHSSISSYSPAEHIVKTDHNKYSSLIQDSPFYKNTNLSDYPDDLTSIETEDDTEDFSFTGKLMLSANYFLTLVLISAFVNFYNYLKNRLPFCRHLSFTSSYKYILQGVLRL
ncbi:hypothetical protein CLV32_4170 [Pedobacter duraquae]|uniref:Uncharacterized protein n=2 Tax=Pedobacter duraquae TaxID=425511 RepID=A0A4R6IDD5_9SPHI|nr:hypothetical protein CLV32_4170 [Pedobacter duraquae]